MVVEVGPEIEQLVFEICRRPEQQVIQILSAKGADEPFHEWMGQGNVGYGLDFRQLQYTQIGLPLVEPIKVLPLGSMPIFFSRHSAQLIGRVLRFLSPVVPISLL